MEFTTVNALRVLCVGQSLTSQSSCSQPDRQTPRAPIAMLMFENAGNFVATRSTTSVFKVPFAELVPVALDEKFATIGAPRAATFAIVHVSSVNIV